MSPATNTISKKRKFSRLFGILIGLGIFLIVIAVMAVIRVTPYNVYKNEVAGIRMKYPAYWKIIDQVSAPGLVVAIASPMQTALDTYAENVNVTFQDLDKPITLPQFSQTAMRQLTGTFKEKVKVLESGPTRLAGRPAYRFSYLITATDPPRKFLHIWVIAGTRAYIFTYNGTEKDFDVFMGEVKAMIKSFTVL